MANGSTYRHGGGRGGGSGRSRDGSQGRSGGQSGGGNNDGSRNKGGGGSAVGRGAAGARGEPRDICDSREYFWSKCPKLLYKRCKKIDKRLPLTCVMPRSLVALR